MIHRVTHLGLGSVVVLLAACSDRAATAPELPADGLVAAATRGCGAPAPSEPLLPPLSISLEPQLYSLNSATPTSVHFVNATCETVNVYWLDFEGHRVLYQTLASGRDYQQQTYVTHPWILIGDRSGPMVIFLPTIDPSAAVVNRLVLTPGPVPCPQGLGGCRGGHLLPASAFRPRASTLICIPGDPVPNGFAGTGIFFAPTSPPSVDRECPHNEFFQPNIMAIVRFDGLPIGSSLQVCSSFLDRMEGWKQAVIFGSPATANPLHVYGGDQCSQGGLAQLSFGDLIGVQRVQ